MRVIAAFLLVLALLFFACPVCRAQSDAEDPFEGMDQPLPRAEAVARASASNFFFKKELYLAYESARSLRDQTGENPLDPLLATQGPRVTASVGFEAYKKFTNPVRDIADLDLHLRLVRTQLLENASQEKTNLQVHNAYMTFYNPLGGAGKMHLRLGHVKQPFGIEPLTDTDSTWLQLSNPANFGFKNDWGVELYGSLSPSVAYDIACTIGSGHDFVTGVRKGMYWGRIGTTDRVRRRTDSEFGFSFAVGQRMDEYAMMLTKEGESFRNDSVDTVRYGFDYRLIREPWRLTIEASTGQDNNLTAGALLGQVDFLHPSRKWQMSFQFQEYYRDNLFFAERRDRCVTGEFDWYFVNTPAATSVLRLNYTHFINRIVLPDTDVWTLQYYLYF